MRIINRTRGSVLGSRVMLADTWWSRFRGFLGQPEPSEGTGILLAPCNSVHMLGMRYALDVVALDADGRVLDLRPGLRPWRVFRGRAGTRYVLEVPVGTIEASETAVGDELSWTPAGRTISWNETRRSAGEHDSLQNLAMRGKGS